MCFNRNSELRLIVSPSNALNKNIGYTVTGDMNSSGTNNIISVTYTNGVFTITPKGGDARGVTTLTVTSKDGSNISATINITVGDYFFIPDEAFRAVAKRYSVLPNPIFVETIDGVDALNTQKAAAYSGNLNFQDKGVTDVTGIEYFTGITHLNIGINKITSLDLSKSKELEVVGCEENPSLKTLNVKGLSKLTTLIANNSILESVDISGLTLLDGTNLAPGNDITAVKIHYSLLGGGTPTQGVPLLTLGTAYTELNRVKNKGTLEHYDTATKVWTPLQAGDFQIIQSNRGIQHQERVAKNSRAFQIWFDPHFYEAIKLAPSYIDYHSKDFQSKKENGIPTLTYIGKGSTANALTPNLTIKKLLFKEQTKTHIQLNEAMSYTFYVLYGKGFADNQNIEKDDAIRISNARALGIDFQGELFYIETPTMLEYDTIWR
ncbi:hypothetical protein CHS0354_023937 [Potamilus streckersoni]|uniref:Uncharacterized protein n=1 Tax=Potamilus streckersoni TaxID=2493646 RepID=A0AAE0RZG5_9BIVA|nr:hypothetical protein CHS0354_023937 [Potamilus streckersoni]